MSCLFKNIPVEKTRSTNWTAEEKKIFLERYSQYRDVLEGKFSSTLAVDDDHKEWEEIAASINAGGVEKQSWQQIKKSTGTLCLM